MGHRFERQHCGEAKHRSSYRETGLSARIRAKPADYPNLVYYFRLVTHGGLISFRPSSIDPYRRAAGYVDRILEGEKPADLPVQAPTKYELVINRKTAMELGIDGPRCCLPC
jgi:ABC transporter substrate binding protein